MELNMFGMGSVTFASVRKNQLEVKLNKQTTVVRGLMWEKMGIRKLYRLGVTGSQLPRKA